MDPKNKVKFIFLNILLLAFFYSLPITSYHFPRLLLNILPEPEDMYHALELALMLVILTFIAGTIVVIPSVYLLGKRFISNARSRHFFYLIHFVLLVVLPIFLYVIFVVGK